ncbi:MAG TPA: chromosome partitioning protein ParB, partial [Gammaproteobacteria bacterium]|nr:chromosome partitioning protein ParB [Gammaproteobacteria bacterium]
AEVVVNKGLSVRETERLVEHLLQKVSDAGATTKTKSQQQIPRDPDVQRLENSLSEKLGASVEVVHGQNGKGRVIIQYNNLEELDGILAHIQ